MKKTLVVVMLIFLIMFGLVACPKPELEPNDPFKRAERLAVEKGHCSLNKDGDITYVVEVENGWIILGRCRDGGKYIFVRHDGEIISRLKGPAGKLIEKDGTISSFTPCRYFFQNGSEERQEIEREIALEIARSYIGFIEIDILRDTVRRLGLRY